MLGEHHVRSATAERLHAGEHVNVVVGRAPRAIHSEKYLPGQSAWILSLGSSRQLWRDAQLVPKDIVLFGNLPTKSFYSDAAMPDEKVEDLTRELIFRMRESGHPHILGSECDVLYVPESSERISRKIDVMLSCGK